MDHVKFFKLWGPVILWAGLIFFCSGVPNLKTDLPFDFLLRKAAHITEYFILTFLMRRAFLGTLTGSVYGLSFYSAAFVVLYAVSDEIHQSFVPGRVCAVSDVAIDTIGIVFFYVFLKIHKMRSCGKR